MSASWMNQGENKHAAERRIDHERRERVCTLAAQTFNREVVRSLAHGEEVDPGALWDSCIEQAVRDTEPSLAGAR